MRYHGNETTALWKLLFITIYYSNIDKKTLGTEKQKPKEVKSNKKLCPIFYEKMQFFLYGTTLTILNNRKAFKRYEGFNGGVTPYQNLWKML